jgi:DNA-binding SARP family transcriptional activator/tetratricopeptide (TPR) repeat protein
MRFLLLGPVQAWAGDQEVPLRRPRRRAVLAHLLLARSKMVSLDGIEQAVWGGAAPATARAQIQADISALRRAFRDTADATPIVTRPGGYELDRRDLVLDVDEFSEQVAVAGEAIAKRDWPGAEQMLRSALALWRGPALAGVEAAFAEPTRARLDEQRLTAIERLAEVDLCLHRPQAVIADLTEHLPAHPYRERLRGLLMLALFRDGRRTDALATARELRRLLADQQGLDPGGMISRLETMILRDDPDLHTMASPWQPDAAVRPIPVPTPTPAPVPARAGVRPNQLPPGTADFTGQATSRERAVGRLAGGGVVAISGMGGVGKTALAVTVAHEVLDRFPDGCLFRDLQGTAAHPADPHTVLGTFLRSLGVAPAAVATDPDERLGQYRSVTAERRILVVLDDAAGEGQVRPLVPTGAGCAVLVTSRRPLLGLDGATGVRLAPLAPAAALELLQAIVGPERVAADPVAAARVAALCGGLPLALRIAGARVAASTDLTLDRLAGLLAHEHRRLAELTAGDRDVRACFRVGYQRLSPSAARLFRLLGLHPTAQFSAHEAAALARSPADADLDELVAAALVSHHVDRFALHDLVRQYARDLAEAEDPPAERESAVRRLLESYVDTVYGAGLLLTAGRYEGRTELPRKVDDPLRFNDSAEAVAWYEETQPGLLGAVAQAASFGWHTETWQLAFGLRTFLRIRHHTDDWIAVNEIGLAAAQSLGDQLAEARVRESMCAAYLQAGRLTDCVETAALATELARALGDRAAVARSHHLGGIAYDRLGDSERAEDHLNQALAEPAYASSADAILGYLSIGAIYGAQGRYDECRAALERARELAAASNDLTTLCVAHHNLAELCLLTGDPATGADHARQEIAIAERTRYALREARGHEMLAECLVGSDRAAALAAWQRAAEIYQQIDPKHRDRVRQRMDSLGAG